jgi:hypothetical protein
MERNSVIRMPLHHVNYIVDDIPNAVDRWAETFGAGPFFWIGEHIEFDEAKFRGEPCVLDHSALIGCWGDIFVELSQIYEISPSPFEHLFLGDRVNSNRVGHLGFVTPDEKSDRVRLDGLGMPQFFRASSGPVEVTFHEAPLLGHPIEVLPQGVEAIAAVARGAAEGWDGGDPIRTMPAALSAG